MDPCPPTDSAESTPRSDRHHLLDGAAASKPRIRFMCSSGGKILPRPHDNHLRYVGGETRIVSVHRHTTFSSLLTKLSKLHGTTNISVKYQLPNEDLDALITVTADEDVENMMEEYDRLSHGQKSARLRLFLFQNDLTISRTSSISSLLNGSIKRENWFRDALNGGSGPGSFLDRGRSDASSIISEMPDYVFGLDNSDDASRESTRIKNKYPLNDTVSVPRPNSPAPIVSSTFSSTSSTLPPPNAQVIPDLPPVKTRPVIPIQVVGDKENEIVANEKIFITQQTGYPGGGQMLHYPNPSIQPVPTVYYMPDNTVQAGNVSVPTVPNMQTRAQFVQPYPIVQGQVPVGFPGMGQMYGAGVNPYEMPAQVFANNASQAMFYGAGNLAVVPGSYPVVPGSYPGPVVPSGEEIPRSITEVVSGRIPH